MKKTTLRQAALKLALVAIAVLSPLGLRAQETLPLYETASDQNQYVPFYGWYGDEVQTNQLIYPASELSDMDGGVITQMVFYVASQSGSNTLCDWVVSIGETSATTLSGIDNTTTLTQVYSGAMTFGASSGATTMTIVFDQPYTYNGGNLLIQFNNPVTNSSAYHRYYFTGIEATGASYCYGDQQDFLPKVTFTYEPAQQGGCEKPETFEYSNLSSNGATLTWTGGSGTYNVEVKGGNYADWTPYLTNTTLTTTTPNTLESNTAYQFRIQSVCSEEVSTYKTLSFTTLCGIISSFPWSTNFDSYSGTTSGSANNLPTCWNYYNGTTYSYYSGYPVVYSGNSYSHSGNNHLRFYSYYSSYYNYTDQYAILPQMADVNTLRIKMYARLYSTSYNSSLTIGVMTDPNDINTFTPLGTVAPTSTTYSEFTTNLNAYTGTDGYIAIKMAPANSNSTYQGVYVDDITVEEIPSCVEPSDLQFVSSTTSTANIQWTAVGNETSWDIYYSTENVAPTTQTGTNTSDNPATISGLTASTTYYVWVRAHCGDGDGQQSPWIGGISFATECEAFTVDAEHHYTQDFNGYAAGSTSTSTPATYPDDNLPLCWKFLNRSDNSGNYPQAYLSSYTDYAVSGNCLFFKSSSSTPLYAILPEYTNNISDLMLTFTYRNEGTGSSNGTLYVSYMTDPTDASTFNTANAIACDRTTTKTEKEVFFPNAPAGSYIAFKYQGGSSNNYYFSIDDVTVEPAPTCRKPSALACDSKTAHTATLSWTENGSANAWQVSYSTTANFDPADGTIVDVDANPGTIEGLAQSTTYYAYVRANCGNSDYSAWNSTKVTFTTIAGNVTPTGLAVNNGSITSSQATATWNAVAGNTLHQYYELYYSVLSTMDPNDLDNDSLITNITNTSYTFTGLTSEKTYYVWVRDYCGTDSYSNWSSAASFTTAAACQTPDGLAKSNVTNNSATITWNTYGQSTFNLRYSTDGENWTTESGVNSPYTFPDNLSATTTYQVQVQATCNTEVWSTVLNFTTACDPVSVTEGNPWTENFDGFTLASTYTPSSRTLPDCWDFTNTCSNSTYKWYPTVYYYSSTDYSNSPNNSLRFYSYYSYDPQDQYAILPEMSDLNTLRIKLYARAYSTSYDATFKVGVMEGNTFVQVGEAITPTTTSYQQYVIPFNSYAGSGTHIAIKMDAATSSSRGVFIDDITVEVIPSCVEPSGLEVVNNSITTNSVQLQWTAGGSEEAWDVYCTTSDVAPTAETTPTVTGTTSNPCTVGSLTPSSHYYAYVRARCSESNKSPWSNAVEFETECEAMTITAVNFINEGFEDYEGTTYSNNGVVPTCWLKHTTGTIAPHVIGSGSYYYKHDGTKALTFYGSGYNYAALPEIANDYSELQISFWMQCESSSSGTLTLGYITDEDNGTFNTFTPIPNLTISSSSSMVQRGPYYLNEVPAEATRLVFRWYYSGQYSCCIDDVVVKLAPTCRPVSNVACDSKTAHTATLSWTNGANDQDAWQISYSTTSSFAPADGTIVDVDANPATIENLAQSTTYHAYVRANCGGGDYSDWSTTKLTFATVAGNVTPTGLTVDNASVTSTSATATWNAVAGNTLHESYDIYWATADVNTVPGEPEAPNFIAGINGTSQNITGLDAETSYKVWVRDNCGTDGYSNWSSAFTFVTAAACQTPDALAASNITTNAATISWNGYGQTEFNLRYSTDAENWETESAVSNPYTLDELVDATTYYVKVQPICADAESWSAQYNFTTLCNPTTITTETPFTENFDNVVTGTHIYSETDGSYPVCWNSYSEGSVYPHVINSGSYYYYVHSGDGTMYFKGESNTNSYLALPVFTNDLSTLMVTFWMQTENASNGTLSLGYITDADVNYNTYQVLKTYDNSTVMTQCDAALGNYTIPNNATRLVFRWQYTGNSWYGACIDDVDIVIPPSYTKNIEANKWYAIATPVHNSGEAQETLEGITNLTSGTYDLYGYTENTGTWTKPTTALNAGKGYIYRRSTAATLSFVGLPNTGAHQVTLYNGCADGNIAGFNLVGNPFPHRISYTDYYTLQPNGSWLAHDAGTIDSTEAFLVYTSSTPSESVIIDDVTPSKKGAPAASPAITFTVSNGEFRDVAYARFDGSAVLPKIGHLEPNAPALSIPVNGKKYAIADLGNGCESFDMVFSGIGDYTISASGDVAYLHLIDKVTGKDIDLLSQPYTFKAGIGDITSRFIVKLVPDGETVSAGNFAFRNGNGWTIEGDGTLEAYDALGRRIFAQEISSSNYQLSKASFPAAGVYVLRMGGNSQKIVVTE